ncbi:unnamed protein product [Sphagnum compactum]
MASSSCSWPRFLFPNPNSFITALDVVILLTGVYLAYNEYSGMGLQYSKFAVAGLHERNEQKSKKKKKGKVFQFKSKTGMLLIYAPADCITILFLAYSLSCYIVARQLPINLHALTELPGIATSHLKQYCTSDFDYRLLAVAAAFSIHFSKRVLEVLFLHRFSGTTVRTSQTKKWYANKVEGFPQDRKILIPKVY